MQNPLACFAAPARHGGGCRATDLWPSRLVLAGGGQALFQGLHNVDHRSPRSFRRGRNRTAFRFSFDQAIEPLLKFVFIFFGIEIGGETLHQLLRQFHFLRIQLRLIVLSVLLHRGNFIAVKHRVKRQAVFPRPEEDSVLALVHR